MKGLFITKFDNPEKAFEWREIDLKIKDSDDVLIEVESFGINYADIMARQGLYGEAPELPFIPGYEVVGTVIETGKDAQHLLHKRVVGFTRFGGYATHAITKITAIYEIDKEFNSNDALALATQYATAYYATNYTQTVRKDEKVLIQASAGGVGIALNQICKLAGATTIGLCGSQDKIDFCKQQGFDHVLNYNTDDYLQNITDLYPEGLDVCFNSLAGKSFKKDKNLLNHTGRMVLYGGASRSGMKGGTLASLKMVWQMGLIIPIGFMMGSKTLIGINMLKVADHKPNIIKHCLEQVFKLYKDQKISPIIQNTYHIDQLNDAHKLIEDRKSIGKVTCYF